MQIEIELLDDPGLKALDQALVNRTRLLTIIGAYLESTVQEAFERGGHPGAPWAPRKVPNLAGVVEDLKAGQDPKPHRFQSQPVLRDKGRLLQSISSEVRGDDEVAVGSSAPYARTHHEGLVSRTDVPASLLPRILRLFKSHPEYRASWGKLVAAITKRGGILEVQVHKRPLVAVGPQETARIVEIVEGEIQRTVARAGGPAGAFP